MEIKLDDLQLRDGRPTTVTIAKSNQNQRCLE